MAELIIRVLRPIAYWWSRIFYRIAFEGAERVPAAGAVIITPNHLSYPDPIWITIPLRRRVYYMAWDALFRVPVLGPIVRFLGAFPVRIEGHDRCAIRGALDHIASGDALVIFPEGGRSTTGKLLGFKPGAFRLALLTGTPVVPVTITGAHEVWPVEKLFPRLTGTVRIVFHEPIPVARVPETIDNAELKRLARALAGEARATVASGLDPSLRPDSMHELGVEVSQGH